MAITFKEKIKTLIKLTSEPKVLNALISLRHSGYFIDKGWFNAFKLNKPVDKMLKPIPWVTYPFIDFLEGRFNKNINLLEFGSGYSTLYFSEMVSKVTAVEHNLEWYKKLIDLVPENVILINTNPDSVKTYFDCMKNLKETFDFILIDGIFRNECCYEAINLHSDIGVVVLDDSERIEYREGINYILSKGFKKIDFWGISPGYLYTKATSIFYKMNNCLNI